ncbi:hypothetical protein MYFR107205_20695 [Mycolicibacterium frederiksbergense]
MVPVLPDIGRFQPTDPAAAAAVPAPVSSLLSALARVLARPSGTTCSQVSVVTATSVPLRSKTLSIGFGGHQVPPEAIVAATLDSSSPLTSMGPRVNEPRFCRFTKSARLSLLSGS